MAVNARDLPEARLRRRLVHAALFLAVVGSVWWAASAHLSVSGLEAQRLAARERIPPQVEEADGVARECGLASFSDPESLRSFPMKISRFPSREESRCADEVTRTRSELIETYLELDRLRPVLAEAEGRAAPSIPVALALAAGLAAWLWLSEGRHRRSGSA